MIFFAVLMDISLATVPKIIGNKITQCKLIIAIPFFHNFLPVGGSKTMIEMNKHRQTSSRYPNANDNIRNH
jgi:hypothetical protein